MKQKLNKITLGFLKFIALFFAYLTFFGWIFSMDFYYMDKSTGGFLYNIGYIVLIMYFFVIKQNASTKKLFITSFTIFMYVFIFRSQVDGVKHQDCGEMGGSWNFEKQICEME